jgi:hypothetical protein
MKYCHIFCDAEYGIVGEVMFWTLAKVLGQAYTADVHQAWIKIFSSMMRVIVPIAVHHELKDNTAQQTRFERQFKAEFGSLFSQSSREGDDDEGGGEAQAQEGFENANMLSSGAACPVTPRCPHVPRHSVSVSVNDGDPDAQVKADIQVVRSVCGEISSSQIPKNKVDNNDAARASDRVCPHMKVDDCDTEIRQAARV